MYSIKLIIILSKRRVFVTIIDLLFYVNQIVSIQIKLQLLLMGVNPSSYTEPKRLNLGINCAVHCSPDRNCVQHKGRKSGDFYGFTSFWENTFQPFFHRLSTWLTEELLWYASTNHLILFGCFCRAFRKNTVCVISPSGLDGCSLFVLFFNSWK